MEPTPLQVSSYTKLLCRVQDPLSTCRQTQGFLSNFKPEQFPYLGSVCASQIKKLRKSFTRWNQLLCRSVLTPNSCTKFKIHKANADGPGVPNLISWTSLCLTDQETQEELYLVEPTHLQVSSYTKLLCKVQDPLSECRQSWGSNYWPEQFSCRTSLC